MSQRVLVPVGVNRPWRDRWTTGRIQGKLHFSSRRPLQYMMMTPFHTLHYSPHHVVVLLKKIHSLHFSCRDLWVWVSEIVEDMNSKHAANKQILGRDKVTNTHSGFLKSLLEVATTYSVTSIIYTWSSKAHKNKSRPWLAVYNKCVLQFSSKAFAQFWFHWVRTHTHTCQLCTWSSQHKEVYIYIYIFGKRYNLKSYLFMDWFFDGKLNFSKHLLFIKFLQKEKEKNSDLKLINPSNFTKVTKLKGGLIGGGFTGLIGWKMDGWDDWAFVSFVKSQVIDCSIFHSRPLLEKFSHIHHHPWRTPQGDYARGGDPFYFDMFPCSHRKTCCLHVSREVPILGGSWVLLRFGKPLGSCPWVSLPPSLDGRTHSYQNLPYNMIWACELSFIPSFECLLVAVSVRYI